MESWQLDQRVSLPLEAKIIHAENVIREFNDLMEGLTYIAFSGGKDSTVLLHMVRRIFPDTPAVFGNTGLEYPEIVSFVSKFDNVEFVTPKKTFKQVIETDGYPVVSKNIALKVEQVRRNPTCAVSRLYMEGIRSDGKEVRRSMISNKWKKLIDAPFKVSGKCCDHLKKRPMQEYERKTGRKPFIGTMASESESRRAAYLSNGGCNLFNSRSKRSSPLSIFTESDIWDYIKKFNLGYCSLYDNGFDRTGCMFCMFGIHLEKGENRFLRMKRTHPKIYKYCMDNLGIREVLEYIGVDYENNQGDLF